MVSDIQALEQGDVVATGGIERGTVSTSANSKSARGGGAYKIAGAVVAFLLVSAGLVVTTVLRAQNDAEHETVLRAQEQYSLATETAVNDGAQVCETATGIRVAYEEVNATHISLPVFNDLTLPSGINPCELGSKRDGDRRRLPYITLYASSSAAAPLSHHKMRLLNTNILQESSSQLLTDQDSLIGAPVHLLTGSFSGWWSNTVTLGLLFGGGTINCQSGTHQNYRQMWSATYGGSHWAGSYSTYCYFYDETIF